LSLRRLQLSDLQVNACGKWTAPNGVTFLELPHTICVFTSVLANAAPIVDFEVGTPPEFPFLAKILSYTGVTPGTLIQVQWPDGRYLQQSPVDLFSFCGTGRRARWLEAPKLCPPNSKIRLKIDNSLVDSESDVELYFEGVLRIPMVNG
jgi:hypothetical protein